MVDFGGWDMPVEYSGLIAEHMAVRTRVGLFDVSHMGEIQLRGPEALDAVQFVSMNDASKLAEGQAQYSALLTPEGTFVDDILVYKFSPNDYLLVVNAGTRPKDYAWIKQHAQRFHCHVSDYSDHYSQLAIQGPQALATLQKLTRVDLDTIKNYWFVWGQVCGIHNVLISRTGYTGEDGFEIYIPSDEATTTRVVAGDSGRRTRVRYCAVRPGRAQHASPGSVDAALRPRNHRRNDRLRSRTGSLLQARQAGVSRAGGATKAADKMAVRSASWSAWR